MYKYYAYVKFELESPLAIGSGKAGETDKDIIRNSKGEPFIPASSLAGVYKTLFDEEKARKYFGFVDKATMKNPNAKAKESDIIVYDARLCEPEKAKTEIRNGVGLDRFKTAIKGAKYDFEILEPGVEMWTCLEYTSNVDESECINRILAAWDAGEIRIGGKTMRGLGQFRAIEKKQAVFRIPEDTKAWLSFDVYDNDDTNWKPWECKATEYQDNGRVTIRLTLKQEGPITIRVYSTEVAEDIDHPAPDYSQIIHLMEEYNQETKTFEKKEYVVIPGTSWAGAIRHSMTEYLARREGREPAETEIKSLFGQIENPSRSLIVFSETTFKNSKPKKASRNAISRFSCGAADSALYTERMYYGGTDGQLTISLPENTPQNLWDALASTLADLHEGFLAVGGETSVGHGLFSIQNCQIGQNRPEELNGEKVYQFIKRKGAGQHDEV
ncbi:MAG: hypothetical protein K6F26_03370 [Lachnospiraceae bacterium]|nr:hypothetical protein [Lachnospiraceae bacterium]